MNRVTGVFGEISFPDFGLNNVLEKSNGEKIARILPPGLIDSL